jgi:hypothetical protein
VDEKRCSLNPIEARLISIELIELYREGAVFHEFGLPGLYVSGGSAAQYYWHSCAASPD